MQNKDTRLASSYQVQGAENAPCPPLGGPRGLVSCQLVTTAPLSLRPCLLPARHYPGYSCSRGTQSSALKVPPGITYRLLLLTRHEIVIKHHRALQSRFLCGCAPVAHNSPLACQCHRKSDPPSLTSPKLEESWVHCLSRLLATPEWLPGTLTKNFTAR